MIFITIYHILTGSARKIPRTPCSHLYFDNAVIVCYDCEKGGMSMKKLLCLFLAILTLSTGILTGCSPENAPETKEEETKMPTTPAPQEETKPAVKMTVYSIF